MRALPEQLTTFDLNLAGCKNVTTLDGLSGFAQPAPALTTLTLCFDGCSIASADGGPGLASTGSSFPFKRSDAERRRRRER